MPAPPPTWNCVGGTCVEVFDGSGTFATLAACEADCGGFPAPTAECDFAPGDLDDGSYEIDYCTDLPADPGTSDYLVIDTGTEFGDTSLDECSPFIGEPGYVVVDEYHAGCCQCPCVPPGTTQLHATVTSTGGCPWSGTVVLNLVHPPARPDTICWAGTIGDEPCLLHIAFCCNCGGPHLTLAVGTPGASVCGDGCCTESGDCSPVLEWTAVQTCHWVGTGAAECCTGTITVVVTL